MDIPNMTLLAWLVVGAIAGFVASEIMGTREGLVMMVLLGIVGAIVGGWVAADLLKIANVTGINLTSVIVAVAGRSSSSWCTTAWSVGVAPSAAADPKGALSARLA